MKAIEKRREIRALAARWRAAFAEGAEVIGQMSGGDVYWHEALGIWGMFGKTRGRGGIERDWNPFGQKPYTFRSNMIVEINEPPAGIDRNLQGVFARDEREGLWVLHQGRMSVSGSRVTEADFIAATGLVPRQVAFSDGSVGHYHKVAQLDAPATLLQEQVAAFVGQCARARAAKTNAPAAIVKALGEVQGWEHGLSPERIGDFDIAARDAVTGRRRHGEIWRALAAELKQRKISHSNDRVGQYGPDLFTYGGHDVLFEIKAGATSGDVFKGIGQLQIYEHLLNERHGTTGYRKVLVVPLGLQAALLGPLALLDIAVLAYEHRGQSIAFDKAILSQVLK